MHGLRVDPEQAGRHPARGLIDAHVQRGPQRPEDCHARENVFFLSERSGQAGDKYAGAELFRTVAHGYLHRRANHQCAGDKQGHQQQQ
jgi:hypothetical protein